jgi:flavin-dependent dehydrogenase
MDGKRVTGIQGHATGGATVREEARIVVGADGLHSRVARRVEAAAYDVQPVCTCAYYAYWRDVPLHGAELYDRPERMIFTGPTNDGLTLVIVYWPVAAFHEVRTDIERHFLAALDLAPGLAERVRSGRRAEPFRGTADLPNFYRRPHGPGWALVGDAGYHKDPITAQGITDAFRDAELLATAIDEGLAGRRPLAEALSTYDADAEPDDAAPLRTDQPVRFTSAASGRDAVAPRRPASQSRASGPLHRHHPRHRPHRRVLRSGKCRANHRRGTGHRGVDSRA